MHHLATQAIGLPERLFEVLQESIGEFGLILRLIGLGGLQGLEARGNTPLGPAGLALGAQGLIEQLGVMGAGERAVGHQGARLGDQMVIEARPDPGRLRPAFGALPLGAGLADGGAVGGEPRPFMGEVGAREGGLQERGGLRLVGPMGDLRVPCEFVFDTRAFGAVQGQGPEMVLQALVIDMRVQLKQRLAAAYGHPRMDQDLLHRATIEGLHDLGVLAGRELTGGARQDRDAAHQQF